MKVIDNKESIISISDVEKGISVIDVLGTTGSNCKCGREAKFKIIVHGIEFELCEICVAELGKCIIDGLV